MSAASEEHAVVSARAGSCEGSVTEDTRSESPDWGASVIAHAAVLLGLNSVVQDDFTLLNMVSMIMPYLQYKSITKNNFFLFCISELSNLTPLLSNFSRS